MLSCHKCALILSLLLNFLKPSSSGYLVLSLRGSLEPVAQTGDATFLCSMSPSRGLEARHDELLMGCECSEDWSEQAANIAMLFNPVWRGNELAFCATPKHK